MLLKTFYINDSIIRYISIFFDTLYKIEYKYIYLYSLSVKYKNIIRDRLAHPHERLRRLF